MAEIGTDIQKVKRLLEQGELVAIPTETVYGLAGNALSAEAVLKIFQTKNRPHFDPLIVHVANLEHAHLWVETISEKAKKLASQFWPGPLTILLKKKAIIPDLVTSGLNTVGIRCPDHPLTRSLLEQLSFPLAAPSANPFGYVSPTQPEHVDNQLGKQIPYILDGGACIVGIESTIIGLDSEIPVIHRLGGVSVEEIEECIGSVRVELNSSSDPITPGKLKSHYAPKKQLKFGELAELLKSLKTDNLRVGALVFRTKSSALSAEHQLILSTTGNLEEAARTLFSALRQLDEKDIDLILAEEVPDIGLGRAINDRLRRAAFD